MEYNLAGIRQRVLIDKLDDEEFDPGIVDRFINDTQRDIFNEYELTFQEKIFSGTIPSGSTMFQIPGDVAEILSQVVTSPTDGSQKDLKDSYLAFREFNRLYPVPLNNQPGQISRWTLFGKNMIVSSPTDKPYTMTIFYITKPDVLTENSDVPQIPEEFSELLVLGAFMRVQKRNEDYDQAAITEGEYKNQLNLLVSRYGFRKSDGPIKMRNQQIAR